MKTQNKFDEKKFTLIVNSKKSQRRENKK